MNKCCEKIYKFAKGEYISTTYLGKYDKRVVYELIIAEQDGTIVATVDSNHIMYCITGLSIPSIRENRESLVGEDKKFYGMINDLSIKFQDGKFIITGSSPQAFTPPVIGKDNITFTKYGEKVLGECFTSTLEYSSDSPTDDSQNSFSDHSNGDTDHELTNLDLL